MSVRESLKGWDTPVRTLRYLAALAATHILASVLLFARAWYVLGESVESVAAAIYAAPVSMASLVFGLHHSTTMTGQWAATVNLAYLVAAGVLVSGMRLRTRRAVEVEEEYGTPR